MGGGGSYYDRDVSTTRTGSRGFTTVAEQQMSRSSLCRELLPFNRRLTSRCKSPLVIDWDVTASVDQLPVIAFDKMPMVAGQIAVQKYLVDVQVSLAANGDVESDQGPLQFCDFSTIKALDPWLKKLWREGNGGGQNHESYEFAAYYYARYYDMQDATMPMFLFVGDEFFRENLSAGQLRNHFGGSHEDTDAYSVFGELREKFRGNVFLLHRYYNRYGLDADIVARWERALGKGYVVNLPEDKAVADMTLGIIALASETRTLAQYVEDMRNRPLEMGGVKYKPQTEERIKEVADALKPLEKALRAGRKTGARKTLPETGARQKKDRKGSLKV